METATNNKSFFCDDNNVKDRSYKFIRYGKEDHHQKARQFVEEQWQIYKPYAEPDFIDKSKEDFHAKTWEMYLGCIFLNHRFSLQKKTKTEGPDLCILIGDRKLWIEAVAPTSGVGDNRISDAEEGVAYKVPVDKIILRFRGAIEEKYRKYMDYRNNRVVEPKDFYVIAVNGGRVNHSIQEQVIPFIVKSVLPFGNLTLSIGIDSGKIVNSYYEYRGSITTFKGGSVSTNIFQNGYYEGISAVLYSCANVVDRPKQIGIEIKYVHNPLAKNKLSLGIFSFGTEWWVEGENLKRKDW
jgi:hypothetical protein